jgi:hypothetical protein
MKPPQENSSHTDYRQERDEIPVRTHWNERIPDKSRICHAILADMK